jgi:hypothetical protein
MGESFSPVLSSGTGTFSVPIAVTPGRAGVRAVVLDGRRQRVCRVRLGAMAEERADIPTAPIGDLVSKRFLMIR